ncbi:glycosyltransferase family 1 protein [Nocardioides oleivorans]|uniref:Glycosyltransferase family 1 protein n=1 Tax=Nocardioides oleivorans TaxID=273676 RepID=A0A4Q2S1Q9_9ACTN|nr:glycosyltransferase family 4 protein [Nocardioides oleivorans]RYB94284.1 glycosyltransferase family 1 protein [Nocardioides oleivorans]
MTEQHPDSRGRRPDLRRGLRGSLDLPATTIQHPERAEVGGWVYHQRSDVVLVVVLADGRIVGTAACDIEREDVASAHDAAPLRSGWSAVVDLGQVGEEVTLSAHALVRRLSRTGEDQTSVLLPFAERTIDVARGGLVRGEVTLPDEVAPGTLRVTGTADVRPSLARVEVQVDDAAPVRARHSLPSSAAAGAGAEERVRGFAATLEIPDGATEVALRVSAVTTDGTRVELASSTVPVLDDPSTARGERLREVRDERLTRYVDTLRDTFPRGRRVLVAAHDLGVGGAQNYLDDIMRGLHERGVEMCVVAGSGGALLERIETTYGAPVLVVGPPPESPELIATRVQLVAGFALEQGAAACLANTLVSFPAVLAASRLGLPTTWAIHESFAPAVLWHEYLNRQADPAVVAATEQALASSDEVMFVAESTRQMYADLVPAASSALVPYGLDIAATDALLAETPRERARAELGIPLDRRVLLCVGSVEPRKGQLALARAFRRLGNVADHASLYLVGATPTAYTEALRSYVDDAGLSNVHVVDSDPDVMRWYAAADVLVSAADVESMPRTMLEAMLAGRPVAAASVFGVPELVEDGVSGWLCEPGDLAALTDLLRRAVTAGTTQLKSMGAAARTRVQERHSSSGFVDHVATRLQGWLGESPR